MSHIIVAGSGIAGLTAALRLAGTHEVTLVTKEGLGESNTAWAQGGIAGVIGAEDTLESHVADTLDAGAGLCDETAVHVLCRSGAEALADLARLGVDFDRDDTGQWARGMEGAHSFARIFHAGGDATGKAIIAALTKATSAEVAAGRIRLLEHALLVDIITAPDADETGRSTTGISLLRDGQIEDLPAAAVVLATGGAGQLFAHTTNPTSATGDGLAAAIRAGAMVRDLEFFQFHPTALTGAGFLISEAVRGAGALLLDERGSRFMPVLDRRGELAPRNVVALAIHRRSLAQDGRPCFLDARCVPEVSARFPSITRGLAEHGLDLAHELIPVTPAAHYFMGGVATDIDGRTSINGLFAVGEVACTGVHGANRLASNSLLEGAVFAARAAEAVVGELNAGGRAPMVDGPAPTGDVTGQEVLAAVSAPPGLSRSELQALTWAHLGVERTDTGLRTLLDRLTRPSRPEHRGPSCHNGPSDHLGEESRSDALARIETANLALIAWHMIRHALARTESRGAHARTDFPDRTAPSTTFLLQEATAC